MFWVISSCVEVRSGFKMEISHDFFAFKKNAPFLFRKGTFGRYRYNYKLQHEEKSVLFLFHHLIAPRFEGQI